MAHTPASASCLTFNAAAGFASNVFADAFDFVKRCLLLRLCVKVVLGWLLVNCEETIEDNTRILRSYVELWRQDTCVVVTFIANTFGELPRHWVVLRCCHLVETWRAFHDVIHEVKTGRQRHHTAHIVPDWERLKPFLWGAGLQRSLPRIFSALNGRHLEAFLVISWHAVLLEIYHVLAKQLDGHRLLKWLLWC